MGLRKNAGPCLTKYMSRRSFSSPESCSFSSVRRAARRSDVAPVTPPIPSTLQIRPPTFSPRQPLSIRAANDEEAT